jgi:hypothetical protein
MVKKEETLQAFLEEATLLINACPTTVVLLNSFPSVQNRLTKPSDTPDAEIQTAEKRRWNNDHSQPGRKSI